MTETTMTCRACYAATNNGLVLCERCRIAVSVHLEFLPVYFRNLTRWRPGRSGTSRPVPGSREPKGLGQGAGDDRVSRALDEVGNDLVTWARKLDDDRGVESPESDGEADQAAVLCRLFAEYLTSIATLDWAGEFVEAMGRNEAWLRGLTLNVAPGWYAGGCKRCGLATYVVPGLTWVTCGGCGVTTYARDHLETIVTEARGWVAPPMRLAEAAVALVDTELSVPRLHKRISKWGEREQIDVVRDSDYAPKRYRFGEVLDRLLSEGATLLTDCEAEAS